MPGAARAPSKRASSFVLPDWPSAGLFLICASLLSLQAFGPHFIGTADNGDFGKVFGWLSLVPVDYGQSNFSYFQPDYIYSQSHFWDSPYYSSEIVPAWIATRLSGATREGAHFDIRVLGAVHAAIVLAALAMLLFLLRRLPVWTRVLVAGVAILAFTDVCYAAYLNTFFMDAVAVFSLLLLVVTAARIAQDGDPPPVLVLLYGIPGLLFVTSKTQHALWTLLPAGYLIYLTLQWRRPALRRIGVVVVVLLLAGGGLELATADPGNRAQALFNKLFYQIGPAGPQGVRDLHEIGVRPEELSYIGLHSYMPDSPAANIPWLEQFYARTGYGRLLAWYLRHPRRALEILQGTLRRDAHEMRQNNLSNYQRAEGHPRNARTSRLAVWSGFRSTLLERWPYHIVIWYALFLAGALYAMRRRQARLAWLAVMIALLGLGQFAVASLADCLETGRHLFMFHACTDLTICFAVAAAAGHKYFTNSTALPRSL
jgi:hypothetical protein